MPESLCYSCVRRDPATSSLVCTVLLAQSIVIRQPVTSCAFYADASGRMSIREPQGRLKHFAERENG